MIYDDNNFITYNQIYDLSNQIRLNIDNRNLILLICSNCIEAIGYYLAFMLSDNVVFIVSDTCNERWLMDYIYDYEPDYICICKDNPCLADIRYEKVVHNYQDYFLIKLYKNSKTKLNDELMLLLPTSGSTGNSKVVRISKKNLLCNTEAIIKSLNITKYDKPAITLPISYTYGLSVINTHFAMGSDMYIINEKIITSRFWELFTKEKCTSISGVPYTFEMLHKFGFLKRYVASLNCMTQAGGKLSDDLIKEFSDYSKSHNIRFYVMYGQTEATARMTCLPYDKLYDDKKNGSVGIPIGGGNIYIEHGEYPSKINGYNTGEIIYSGDNVSMGYAKSNEDLIDGDLNKGILHTGDIGYLDDEGYLYIVGRKNRFIKLYGIRYNLDDIENFLQSKLYPMNVKITGKDSIIKIEIECTDNLDLFKNKILDLLLEEYGIRRTCVIVEGKEKVLRFRKGL